MSKIHGLVYDIDRIDITVPFGDVELWQFVTSGNAPHPVHVHGASFQVVSRSGGRGRVFPWEGGWKDTVLLNDRETVQVLIRFAAYRGEYLIHCHKLEHEDNGMMSNFRWSEHERGAASDARRAAARPHMPPSRRATMAQCDSVSLSCRFAVGRKPCLVP
jgi:Multicopper oxidase